MIALWAFLILVIGTDGKMALRPSVHATWQQCDEARIEQQESAVTACVLVKIPDHDEG